MDAGTVPFAKGICLAGFGDHSPLKIALSGPAEKGPTTALVIPKLANRRVVPKRIGNLSSCSRITFCDNIRSAGQEDRSDVTPRKEGCRVIFDVEGLHQEFGMCKIFTSPFAPRGNGLAVRD